MFNKETGAAQNLIFFAELLSTLADSADITAEKNLRITEDNLRIANKNLKLQDRVLILSIAVFFFTLLQVFLVISTYSQSTNRNHDPKDTKSGLNQSAK